MYPLRSLFTLAEESIFYYMVIYATFVACFTLFVVLTNLFKVKLDASLYRMSCNLIILFACGIATSSLNNLTHYLHHKGEALYAIPPASSVDSTSGSERFQKSP